MIPKTLHKLILTSLTLTASLAWTNAFAVCKPDPGHSTEKTITLPASISIKSAKVGEVMASNTYELWRVQDVYTCRDNDTVSIAVNGGLELSEYSKVYKTGIEGVGIKVGLNLGYGVKYTPYSFATTPPPGGYYAPQSIVVDIVRIDTGVASGRLPTFNATLSGGGMTYTIKTSGSTEVKNEVLFSSCTAVDTLVDVQMGQENIERIRSGRSAVHPFNFDVRCTGLKPNATVPVKVYFEGNSSSDGILALSGAGTAGVASGFGIALVNDKGVKLPFAKARSVQIQHHRSDEEGEIYRFSGTAKYVLTSGEVKPGKADATMTYVIDYN
ncbi:fimbrial protein [Pseudomonas sp. GCM10022186]|uniref:fimbrial protein n=1 Tax=Pseudomonas sp. GCM10022186 TaxID=3252650 RepID=UPI0036075C9A